MIGEIMKKCFVVVDLQFRFSGKETDLKLLCLLRFTLIYILLLVNFLVF